MTDDQHIESLIISFISHDWQKTAKIVALVSRDVPDEAALYGSITARLRALIDCGQIEARGDVALWRESEVRTRMPEHSS